MDSFQNAEQAWKEGRTFIRFVVDTVREPFLLLDKDLRILSANESFYRFFLVTPEETEGQKVYDIGNKQWDIPHLKKLLEDILPKETFFKDFEMEHVFTTIGRRVMLLNARLIYLEDVVAPTIMLAMEDVTKQRVLEEKLARYSEELENKVGERTQELAHRIAQLEQVNDMIHNREREVLELRDQVRKLQVDLKAISLSLSK